MRWEGSSHAQCASACSSSLARCRASTRSARSVHCTRCARLPTRSARCASSRCVPTRRPNNDHYGSPCLGSHTHSESLEAPSDSVPALHHSGAPPQAGWVHWHVCLIRTEAVTEVPLRFYSFHLRFLSGAAWLRWCGLRAAAPRRPTLGT
jgi:hypothetical protein